MTAATPTANFRLTALAFTSYVLGLQRVAVWLERRAIPKPYREQVSPEVCSRLLAAIHVHRLSPEDAARWATSRPDEGMGS